MSYISQIDAITNTLLWRQYNLVNTKTYKLSTPAHPTGNRTARVNPLKKSLHINITIIFQKNNKIYIFFILPNRMRFFVVFWGISPPAAPRDAGCQLKCRLLRA